MSAVLPQSTHGLSPWDRLKEIARPERKELGIAVSYSIAIGLVSLVLPVTTQAIVNTIAFGVLLQPLLILSVLVFVALTFAALLQSLRTWVVEIIQRRIFVRLAGETAHRLANVRPDAFDQNHGPELVNRFLEVVTVQKAASSLLVDGLSVLMSTLIGMTLLAVYHPWLLAFDVFLLVSILIVVFPLGTGAVATSVKESGAKYNLLAWLEELARHQINFKTREGAALAMAQTDELACVYLNNRSKHFRILMRQIVGGHMLQAFASASLLGVGGWLVINRQLSLGQLVAAELVVAAVVASITKFGKHLETFYDLLAATDKLGYIADLPLESGGAESLPRASRPAAVRVTEVAAGYPGKKPLLEGVSFELPPGARIGLAGPAGSGKSTLLGILYGLRAPLEGHVEIDGRDYRDLHPRALRSSVALVRTPEVFEGTVMENLRLGDPSADAGRAREALAQVGLLDEVAGLPEGLNTRLATGGLPLSLGQTVQLELARALLRQPRLLLLDDCLDQVDDLVERERLLDALFDPAAPWTLLVSSQDRGILERCEKRYAVANRSIVEVK